MTLAARMGEAPKEEPAEAATLATLSSNPRPRRAKSESASATAVSASCLLTALPTSDQDWLISSRSCVKCLVIETLRCISESSTPPADAGCDRGGEDAALD